jgi:hypothetical protein
MKARIGARPRRGRVARERFRFPCGHLEPRGAVEPRIKMTAVAAWVACQRCALIVLAVQPPR